MYHLGIGEVVSVCSITGAIESLFFKIYEDFKILLIRDVK